MDLLKVFDSINRNLLTAKLKAYGISKNSFNLKYCWLKKRQRKFESIKDLAQKIPKGSIDESLLFKLSVNNLCFWLNALCEASMQMVRTLSFLKNKGFT